MGPTLSRRSFIAAEAGAATAPAAATKPAAAAQPAASPTAPAPTPATLANVARNETVIMSVSDIFNQFQDAALANPFLRGQQRTGWHIVYEPLCFYNRYWTREVTWPKGLAGKETEIPWLAESYQYNKDSTELTMKLRPGVTWSDGLPFGAKDVAFTLNMLRENSPELVFSFDMKTWLKDVQTPDQQTVKLVLTSPNPQFMGRYFQWFQDLGFPIVPEHVFKGQDVKTFTNLDLGKGWPPSSARSPAPSWPRSGWRRSGSARRTTRPSA
jgi:peptide/nickel transport system substrate-binding protein